MRHLGVVFSFFLSALASSVATQIRLTRDINQEPGPNPSSQPAELVSMAGTVYLAAESWAAGYELFATGGTPSTTRLVADIRPGRVGSAPHCLTVVGSTLYFAADDGSSGVELWQSVGTAAGTVRVADLNPGAASSDPRDLVGFMDGVLFTAVDEFGARGLYRSDGSTGGTVRIHAVAGRSLHMAGSLVWFDGGTSDPEVWRTDGTTVGTVPVFQVPPFGTLTRTYSLNGRYYFATCQGLLDSGLFESDGTASGTQRVATLPFRPYCTMSSPTLLGAYAGKLWLSIDTMNEGRELWKSDGTAAGTVLVKDLAGGGLSSSPSHLVGLGSEVFFVASDGVVNRLWKSDGTDAGTVPLTVPGTAPAMRGVLGNRVWFAGHDAAGEELWVTDGSQAATVRVTDINPGPGDARPTDLVEIGLGRFVLVADDGVHAREPWSLDIDSGPNLVADLKAVGSTLGAGVRLLGERFGTVFFAANDGTRGEELWKSDGTSAGTVMVKDLAPGAASSWPRDAALVRQNLYFKADTGGIGTTQVFATDGTSAGTVPVTAFSGGLGSGRLTALSDKIYFTVVEPGPVVALWRLDAATHALARVQVFATANEWALGLTAVGDLTFFVGFDPVNGYELWKTDGTPAGTVLVKDTYPGTAGLRPAELAALGDRLLFAGSAPNGSYRNLWSSDGTTAGTQPFASQSDPRDFVVIGNEAYFTGNWHSFRSLFKTDGTSAGTINVSQWFEVRGSLSVSFGAELVVPGFGSAIGTELHLSDGTIAGTRLVREVEPGPGGNVHSFTAVGSRRVFFAGSSRTTGDELWFTDGTAAGTALVEDLYPGARGALSAGGGAWVQTGGKLFFAADNGESGTELFVLDVGATAQSYGLPCGLARATQHATDPVLGGTMSLDGRHAPLPSFAVVVFGLGPTYQFFGCTSYVQLQLAAIGFSVPSAAWRVEIPIPNDASAAGLRLVVQTWYVGTQSSHGIDLSDAVEITLGR